MYKKHILYLFTLSPFINNYGYFFNLCPCKFLHWHNYKFTNLKLRLDYLIIKTDEMLKSNEIKHLSKTAITCYMYNKIKGKVYLGLV